MTNNYKTIKELADELGVSKQTIHYHVKSLSNIKRDKNNKGAVLLNKEEQNFIYEKVGGTKSSTIKDDTIKDSTIKDSTIKDDTNYFLSEIQFLRIQLENKDDQIVKMQSLLDQQQRLALQDKKILEEYKQENDRLKALKSPSEEFREPVDSRQKDDQNKKEASIETAKKWWQIWKT